MKRKEMHDLRFSFDNLSSGLVVPWAFLSKIDKMNNVLQDGAPEMGIIGSLKSMGFTICGKYKSEIGRLQPMALTRRLT